MLLLVWLPLGTGVADAVLLRVPQSETMLGTATADPGSPLLYLDAMALAAALLVLGIVAGLLSAAVLGRPGRPVRPPGDRPGPAPAAARQ
ncbi:hypothetical protein [Pseudonocardia sp. NPDC046786]|uniref:hypothetical protein n=1 Tax=Pseudonocardia sp. NPDC046786 TaxID=3155471 RepID=UPI0033CB522A